MNLDIERLKKSEDLAFWLGMFVGDGCLSVKKNGGGRRIYPISFFNTQKYQVELFASLSKELLNLDGKIRGRKRENRKVLWEFEKYSVKIYKIVNNDFEIACGKKALLVRIPSFIRNGGFSSKRNFFCGLLLTDGGIKKKDGSIIFHSASKALMLDMKKLVQSVWNFDREVREYTQRNHYKSYQLTLNKRQSLQVLSEMPRSHNLVLR